MGLLGRLGSRAGGEQKDETNISHNARLFLNNLEVRVVRDRFENLTVAVQVQ